MEKSTREEIAALIARFPEFRQWGLGELEIDDLSPFLQSIARRELAQRKLFGQVTDEEVTKAREAMRSLFSEVFPAGI